MKLKNLWAPVLSGAFLAASLVFAQTEVSSVNIVGYAKKEVSAIDYAIIGVNFDKIGGGTNTLIDFFGTNTLKQNATWSKADKVILWEPASLSYKTYAQSTGLFYEADDLAMYTNAIKQGLVQNSKVIPAGTSFYFAPGGGATNKTITILGQVVTVATNMMDITNNMQLLAYPFTCDSTPNNMGFFNSGAARHGTWSKTDQIIVFDGTNYQTYGLWTNGLWYYANTLAEYTNSYKQGITVTNPMTIGQGFWYVAKSNMVWSETNVYLQNLMN